MSEIPKKMQQHFEDIKKYLGIGDEEAVQELLKNRDPYAIRNILGTALGQHVNENYNTPTNAFENSKLLEKTPIQYGKLPANIQSEYNPTSGGILMPRQNPDIAHAQTGDLLHELGHKDDIENKGWQYNLAKDISEQPGSMKDVTGLPAALKEFGNHHESGFFEKEALQKLLSGGKLGVLGALGAGAMALGAGNKAMAGDLPGAALDAGAIVDPTGIAGAASQIKDRLNNPDYKKYSDADQLQALPPGLDIEQSAIQQNDNTPDNKFSKLKQMLGK